MNHKCLSSLVTSNFKLTKTGLQMEYLFLSDVSFLHFITNIDLLPNQIVANEIELAPKMNESNFNWMSQISFLNLRFEILMKFLVHNKKNQ